MTAARSWLPVVLRARQAQEDLVAQVVAVARRDAQLALDQHIAEVDRVAAMPVEHTVQSGQDFQATTAALAAAAATLAAARNRSAFAQARVETTMLELTEAARTRRSVEKLYERDVEANRVEAEAKAQRELDEISISRHSAHQRRVAE